jgi:hypothetical protein
MNQAKNTYLMEYQRLLINKANLLKTKEKKINFSRWKYKAQECHNFNTFINFIKDTVNITRKFYREKTGKLQPFLTIAHDGWDSKRRDVLGVSIHFICSSYWIPISFPVGLRGYESKKSKDMVIEICKILAR